MPSPEGSQWWGFMQPLTQQMFIEHPLYARHYTRGCEHNKSSFLTLEELST